MRASYVTALAFVLLVIGRWANNKTAITLEGAVGMAFAIVVIAALDGGKTEPIAKGLAWLLLAAVVLNNDDPLNGIVKAINAKQAGTKTAKKSNVESVLCLTG